MEKSKKGKEVSSLNPSSSTAPSLTGALSLSGQEQNQTGTLRSSTNQEQSKIISFTPGATTNAGTGASSSNANEDEIQVCVSPRSNASIPGGARASGAGGSCPSSPRGFPGFFDLINEFPVVGGIVSSMVTGPDGVLYTASAMGSVQKWVKGRPIEGALSFRGPIYAICLQYLGPDIYAFLARDGGVVNIWGWRAQTWGTFRSFSELAVPCNPFGRLTLNMVNCMSLSDDNKLIYIGTEEKGLHVWSVRRIFHVHEFSGSIQGHYGAVKALAVGPRIVCSGSGDGVVRVWTRHAHGRRGNKVTHQQIASFLVEDRIPMEVNALVFHKVDEVKGWLYAGSRDRKVRCWKNLRIDRRQADQPEPELMTYHQGSVTCLASCSGPFVFSGSKDGKICAWRRESEGANHTLEMVLDGHKESITCIAAQLDDWSMNAVGTPRRWILYSSSLDGTLRIWRVYEQPPEAPVRSNSL